MTVTIGCAIFLLMQLHGVRWRMSGMELRAGVACAGKARGFAFAGFMCRAHAEKGIKVANGQVIYRVYLLRHTYISTGS